MVQQNQINEIQDVITKLKDKNFNLYFFTFDTKGNPSAGIANIYEHVKILNELGYNAVILHEKNDYRIVGDSEQNGVTDWLGAEYGKLPHKSIEAQDLKISPADYIFIPEVFANVMGQIKGFPCRKVVFAQSYDYLFESLPIGTRWDMDYGFTDVITTSKTQADYLDSLFPTIRKHIVPVSIPEYFKKSDKPKIPVVSLHVRTQGDAAKIAKSFYLQYPTYKWITFKELRGLSRPDFAKELGKSCLAVWVDDASGFGTFPIECIESETPVIGKIPTLIPEWMETVDAEGNKTLKNNGIWTNSTLNIPELIATYLKVWLEDSVPTTLTEGILADKSQYTSEKQVTTLTNVYSTLVNDRIAEFETILTNLTASVTQ